MELMALLADREWLDEATKTIGQFWEEKMHGGTVWCLETS
jgi:hypothetical protein